MKSKSISFAQVLKRNTKSPKIDLSRNNFKLSELVQQFDTNPDQDYTLYLGQIGMSHKSKPSPFHMAFSRNHTENQEEMFDSWIQKQSTLGPNKENIRNQSKATNNEPIKRFEGISKIQGSQSKVRQNGNNLNSYTSKGQKEMKMMEQSQSQSNFSQLNIQMIKSNHYENEQFNKIRSPRAEQKLNQNIQFAPVRNPFLQTQNTSKDRERQEPVFKKEVKQHQIVNEKQNRLQAESQSINFKAVEQQISDIVSKYKDDSDQEKEEQMLLAQSNDRQEEILYTESSKKAQEADDLLKKRLENAKSILGNYFEKIKKDKEVQKQTKIQRQRDQNQSSHLVGYSFSTNYLPQQSQIQNRPQSRHLNEIVAQAAEQSQENDSNFRRKYLNLTSFEIPPHEKNNIESVKYSNQSMEQQRLYGIPYGTMQAKLIKSNDRHPNQDSECRQEESRTSFSPKQEEEPSKNSGFLINPKQPSCKMGKSKQKISLISSRSKSNKRSPTSTVQQKQHEAPPTTDFTIIQKPVTKLQPTSTISSRQLPLKHSFTKEQTIETKIEYTRQQPTPTYATASSTYNPKLPTDYYSTNNYTSNFTKQASPNYATSTQPESRSSYTSNYLIGSKTDYPPLKIETPYTLDYSKKQDKKQPTYAVPTQTQKYTSYLPQKETKANYFSKLDIKESITMEDKNKYEPTYKNSIANNYLPTYSNGIKQYKTGFVPIKESQNCNNFLGQSLKKSINLSQSGEFTFDL